MFKTILSALDPKKKPTEAEINKIQPFIFCRWLSGDPRTILSANQFNINYNIPIKNQYDIVKQSFSGKIKYIPFPKNVKNETPIQVKYLQLHFKISEVVAMEYLELIDKDELKEIVDMYQEYELKHGKL